MQEYTNWLPLNEYATRYKVSASTLRRRIKSQEILFRFVDGRYVLPDAPLVIESKSAHAPIGASVFDQQTYSQISERMPMNIPSSLASSLANSPFASPQAAYQTTFQSVTPEQHVLQPQQEVSSQAVVQGLLAEIKQAYKSILSEKEEQILQLKEEVADLQTLVRVLENEVTRLQLG